MNEPVGRSIGCSSRLSLRMLVLATLFVSILSRQALGAAEPTPESPSESTLSVDDLRAPTSPAFELLGVSPSSVVRPESPRAFIANIISTIAKDQGFPQNYALEVTPYWLFSHPTLKIDGYLDPNVGQTLLRTVSVSVATAERSTDLDGSAAESGTNLALGVRGLIRAGRPNPSIKSLRDALHQANAKLLAIINSEDPLQERLAQVRAEREEKRKALDAAHETLIAIKLQQQIADSDHEAEELRSKLSGLDKEFAAQKAKVKVIALEVQAVDAQRTGFLLAYAAAAVWEFPGDAFRERRLSNWGAWLTPTYRILRCGAEEGDCRPVLDFIAVGRYLRDRLPNGMADRFDLGGRLLWQPQKEFALSAEYVKRTADKSNGIPSTYRLAGVIEYRVTDDAFIYGSFGRDFEEKGVRRNLVSIVGVNIGFGKKPSL